METTNLIMKLPYPTLQAPLFRILTQTRSRDHNFKQTLCNNRIHHHNRPLIRLKINQNKTNLSGRSLFVQFSEHIELAVRINHTNWHDANSLTQTKTRLYLNDRTFDKYL
jgi:hypothetical protein